MLEVKGLVAGFGPMIVLHGIDLHVSRGEIVTVLGSNGAGKTTLNNTLSGLVTPRAGSVRLGDADITAARPQAIVDAGLVHVPEGRRIFPDMSVRENLLLGSFRRARQRRGENMQRVLGIFPRLGERLSQVAGSLSGGEQQMLAIGRALMAEPALLVLDEPSLGLSPLLVEELFALIAELNAGGLPILLVEQNVVLSLAIAHRAYVIENGQVTLEGKARDLADNPELRRSYLGI